MKKVIGFRVEPTALHWAVVEGESQAPILSDACTIKASKSFSEAEQLSHYRGKLINLIEAHSPSLVALRDREKAGRSQIEPLKIRSRVEGVILEASHSCGIQSSTLKLVSMSSLLSTKESSLKKNLKEGDFRSLDWSSKTQNLREAILVAIAGLDYDD